ncbi:MAG: phosphoglucomutase/phosphomannomutase family protein [Acidobacteriota bacterium]
MIRFGTAGWRGIIGEDFTFRNVRLVTQAIANYLLRPPEGDRSLVIGYDTRFLSEKFAAEAAKVLSHNHILALRCSRDTPAPALAHAISQLALSGGLNFTASHNPPEYTGLKLSEASGAPSLPEVTAEVENELRAIEADFHDEYFLSEDYFREINPTEGYLERLRSQVDLRVIAGSKIKLGVDVLYGTGRAYLDRLLIEEGVPCEVLHNFRDPYFGGYGPDPSAASLAELAELVASTDCALGLATDIDADRFAIVDGDGTLLNANDVLGLLLDYILGERGPKGDVARTVATTHLIDRVADAHGVKTFETPVGFKYIGDLIRQGQVVFGGEESAGLTVSNHLPEKDGILACLLVAELTARNGAPLGKQLEDLWKRVGRSFHIRHDYRLSPAIESEIDERVRSAPNRLAGRKIREVKQLDGVKLLFDEAWFLWRRSGTEQLVRCYAEAPTEEEAESLHAASRDYLFGSHEVEMV